MATKPPALLRCPQPEQRFVTFPYLHGIVELFLFPLLLHSFLLFLQELLRLEVARGPMLHGVVRVLGICLRNKPGKSPRPSCGHLWSHTHTVPNVGLTTGADNHPQPPCFPDSRCCSPATDGRDTAEPQTATIRGDKLKSTCSDPVFAGTEFISLLAVQRCALALV